VVSPGGGSHRQRLSLWRVFGFICPVQVWPGGGVTVVVHCPSVGDQVDTARVPSLYRVMRRFSVGSGWV
jgi:hypothetical protein